MKPFNLEEYLANPSKKIVTRDGKDARIICTDCKNYEYPIVALVTCDDDEFVINCTKEGKCHTSNKYKYDLFFATEKREGWVNVYMNCNERHLGTLYGSKKDALEVAKANDNYVATVKIEWEE